MKYHLSACSLMLSFSCLLPQIAFGQECPEQDNTAVVKVSTTPWAIVVIDGKPRGNSPRSVSLKPGIHSIRLDQPASRKRASKEIILEDDEKMDIQYSFKDSRWRITSKKLKKEGAGHTDTKISAPCRNAQPAEFGTHLEIDGVDSGVATVYVDGVRIGEAPVEYDILTEGSHIVRLDWSDGPRNIRAEKNVTVVSGDKQNISLSLDFASDSESFSEWNVINVRAEKKPEMKDGKKKSRKDGREVPDYAGGELPF